ncbi:integral membrane protein DUF92-domain-containing protein [Apiospora phragmitis]|uniref:Integral membrane protein DUF92-domain-containing protein n=1 Tax=Apiospora phragmitis TaxID=2905665 RepID=A0ABR1TRT3_9PEZI
MKAIIAAPATLALVYRAYSHNSLTPLGIVAAALTATAHAVHPWNLPFMLLCVFFLAGTRVTKVKKDVKAGLTLSSQGSSGGEGPRTHVQVLANSFVASALTLLHAYQLHLRRGAVAKGELPAGSFCYSWGKGDLLVIGIIANYAAVAADTFSSELGILSQSEPRLITSLSLRKVPRGTNGGRHALGDASAGQVGGGPAWTVGQKVTLAWGLTVCGALGSLLDSFLGGIFQRSVRDARSGKIVEGDGGVRVLVSTETNPLSQEYFKKTTEVKSAILKGEGKAAVEKAEPAGNPYDPTNKHRSSHFGDHKPTRMVESGFDWLDNNDVNFLMALTMSISAMAGAGWYWGIPLSSILQA